MSKTIRTVRVVEGGRVRIDQTHDANPAALRAARRQDRQRAARDAKRIERSERYAERHDHGTLIFPLGSTVRAVAS